MIEARLSLRLEVGKLDKSNVSLLGSDMKLLIVDSMPLEALTFCRH